MLRACFLIVAVLLASGCSRIDPVSQEKISGHTIKIQSHYQNFFDSQRTEIEIWFDSNVVFSHEVSAPLGHVAQDVGSYKDAPKLIWNKQPEAECLYVNPSKMSKADFEVLRDYVSDNRGKVSRAYGGKVGGLVYGNESDFSEKYKGADGNHLIIGPDGDVHLDGGYTSLGHRLGNSGQLQVSRDFVTDVNALRQYRNELGRSVSDVYRIELVSPSPSPH